MFLKKVSLILATALLAFSLTGCGGGDKKEEKKAPAADKPIKIGVRTACGNHGQRKETGGKAGPEDRSCGI